MANCFIKLGKNTRILILKLCLVRRFEQVDKAKAKAHQARLKRQIYSR